MVMRRLLYLTHRWLGIVTCLLFAIWFISGLVMIYVPFPALTEAEWLTGSAAIDWARVRVQPRDAFAGAPPKRLVLRMRDATPVWRVEPWHGATVSVSALTGARLGPAGSAEAARTAAAFGRATVAGIDRIALDQWTVAGGFDRHRPLWKVALAGPGGRVVYVSSTSGDVVLDTDVRERLWNWLGSVPHWIYPTILRQDNALWRGVVMWVAGPCIVGAVAGMWIGILRVRLGARRFKGGRMTPYRGWMRWHHHAGLIGGTFLTTWIISGWLSVDPGRFFASPGLRDTAGIAYAGAGVPPMLDFARLARAAPGARQVELRRVAGRPLLDATDAAGSRLLDAVTLAPTRPSPAAVLAAAARLVPGARLVAVERLTAPDGYWYEVGALPVLPILRLRFDNPAATWVHIDPATGVIVGSLDHRRRLYRWAFDLLHKWDLNVLTLNRPAWDAVLWTLSILGLVTSISGVRIAWMRLRRRSTRVETRQLTRIAIDMND